MAQTDVIVIGGGISGIALAWKAAKAGKQVSIIEKNDRLGGCIHSHRDGRGHWFEMGAHTVYNSYGGFVEMAEGAETTPDFIARGDARKKFGLLKDGHIDWMSPISVLFKLSFIEAGLHFPFGLFRKKDGKSVATFYSGLIGPNNFQRVLSPFFAAVPSQSADGFPIEGDGSLFKKRPRREDRPRSYGFNGGLQTLCEVAAHVDGITIETGVTIDRLEHADGTYIAHAPGGRTYSAPLAAVATPPDAAAAMLGESHSALATTIERVATVDVESMGVVLDRGLCNLPECAFVVPVDDVFFSCVTRDPFPDSKRRAFAFHFRPGISRQDKLRRMADVLKVEVGALGNPVEQRLTLPAPAVRHGEIVAELDRQLEGTKLALVGNYFAGLSIEDCVQRGFGEWQRLSAA